MNGWIGRTLGKVQIESLLARGGVAEIYLGTHTTLQRRVAIKILRNQYEDDPDLLERFQREAIVVSRLRHPNIVQIFDFDTVESHPYIVMEYIAGPSLSRYLDAFHGKGRRLELPVISLLLSSVAGALDYAHEKGVIHRDVKPGNILLTSQTEKVIAGNTMPASFEPVLTDFGLLRFLNSSRQTSSGQIAGTPAYMSPEQARGETTDERTDIYSLGVVLYEMLSGGRVPFEGETTMSVLLKHIHDPPDPIPGLAPALQAVLNHALAKNRADRYRSPLDFASAFQAAIEQRSFADTLIHGQPVTAAPATKSVSRNKFRPALIAGTIALLAGALIWLRGIPDMGLETANEPPATVSTTAVSYQAAFIQLGSTGILRFQNGRAIADQAVLIAQAMPLPPTGSQYEVWLIGREDRQNLGILSLDERGKGELIYTDAEGINLIDRYDRVEITLEEDIDADPISSGLVLYASTMPAEGRIHLLELLSSAATDKRGLIHGLEADIKEINRSAHEMKTMYANGDKAGFRKMAEMILNLLVGDQSPEYQDWDGDGELIAPLNGYGLLLNGSNLGYIQAVFSEADYAANSPGATQTMIVQGEQVKTCIQNLAQWTPQLHEAITVILESLATSDLTQSIQDSVTLADLLLNGTDLDGNGAVDPLLGECGAQIAYESAYFMADMHLLPVNLNTIPETGGGPNSPSATNAGSIRIATPTRPRVQSQNTPVPPAITPRPHNTHRPPNENRPTKKP